MATIVKRRGKFLARVRLAKLKPISQMFAKRADAKDWAATTEKRLRKHLERIDGVEIIDRTNLSALTIGGLVSEYLADQENKRLKSYYDISQRLAWFVNKYGKEKALSFGALKLRDARSKLTVGRSNATVNRYLSCLRSVWNWAIACELIDKGYTWPKRLLLTEPDERKRFLSVDEFAALKKATADTVLYAAIVVSIATGVRQGELLRLTWADVDLQQAKITMHKTKNGQSRSARLLPSAIEALKVLKHGKIVSLSQHVFLNTDGKPLKKSLLETRWRKVRTAAGLVDFHWHDFRHTAASMRMQQGATGLEIGALLGHTSPTMTRRYSHQKPNPNLKGDDEIETMLST